MADEFSVCVNQLQQKAANVGVTSQTINNQLARVQFVPRVIELDRAQPEFNETFANYLNKRVTEQRVVEGQALLSKHQQLLNKINHEFGIPPQYLLAFWGLETNYGNYLGKMSVLDSLATLACDKRRSEYFTGELFAALRLIDGYGIDAERMLGSWAGAMGHTQFMPTAYHRYALDGDGDGKIDLWGSVPDALRSAANFLKNLGWQKETRWGREVRLPAQFNYQEAGSTQHQPLNYWDKLAIRTAYDAPLPKADLKARLIVPASYQGPAFLVYENFDVIMGWNRSEFYALSVGYLADRIQGSGTLKQPPPTDQPRLHRTQVEAIQKQLNLLGFSVGETDGILGPATRQAIRAFQVQQQRIADGYPSLAVIDALGVKID